MNYSSQDMLIEISYLSREMAQIEQVWHGISTALATGNDISV